MLRRGSLSPYGRERYSGQNKTAFMEAQLARQAERVASFLNESEAAFQEGAGSAAPFVNRLLIRLNFF